MKKENTFSISSWMHKIVMLSCLMFASGSMFAQNHYCDAHFFFQQGFGDTVYFVGAQNPYGTQYSWTFGDGGTATTEYAKHAYATTGTYYVCLTVTDSTFFGVCTNTHCDSVVVSPPPPPPPPPTCNAKFTSQVSSFNPLSVYFNSPQNPYGTTYSWTFGDGGISDNDDPGHTYATCGTYYVCLTVTDTTAFGNCSNSFCDSVKVSCPPPPPPPACNANFYFQREYYHPNVICFDAAQNPYGSHYSWTFGDGGTSDRRDTCYAYASSGTYVVCLTVTDTTSSGTCSDSHCDTIKVVGPNPPPPPTCNAHFKAFDLRGVTFFVSSPNPPRTHYSWDFGDGGTSAAINPKHAYATTGTYYVCLTVNDTTASGTCTDMHCDSVRVGPPPPPPPPPHHFYCNAHFRFLTQMANDTVKFFSAFNSRHTTYSWDFGDGTFGTGRDPQHVFPDTLVYNVCLTVTDSDSTGLKCKATWCDSVHVGKPRHWKWWDPRMEDTQIENVPSATIYPNPMSETATLHIENTSGIVTLRIFDLNGRIVTTKQLGNGDFPIDRSNLTNGMYFYEIMDENNGVVKGKLLVQ